MTGIPWWHRPPVIRYLHRAENMRDCRALLATMDERAAIAIVANLGCDFLFHGLGGDLDALAKVVQANQPDPQHLWAGAASWLEPACCSPFGGGCYVVPARWVRAVQAAGLALPLVADAGPAASRIAITQRCLMPATWQVIRLPSMVTTGPFAPSICISLPPWMPIPINPHQWAKTLLAAAGPDPVDGSPLARLGWMVAHRRHADGTQDPITSIAASVRALRILAPDVTVAQPLVGPGSVRLPIGWLSAFLDAIGVPINPHGPVSPYLWEAAFWKQIDLPPREEPNWWHFMSRDSAVALGVSGGSRM